MIQTPYTNITKDENWQASDGKNHTTEEFKNKQGQVLLKRTYNNSQLLHDTLLLSMMILATLPMLSLPK